MHAYNYANTHASILNASLCMHVAIATYLRMHVHAYYVYAYINAICIIIYVHVCI